MRLSGWARPFWCLCFTLAIAVAATPVGAQTLLSETFPCTSSLGSPEWFGKNGASTPFSGTVTTDPQNSSNCVLTLGQVTNFGDTFSKLLTGTSGVLLLLEFDYLGDPTKGGTPGDLGGVIGISNEFPGGHRWLAGTSTSGGIEQDLLIDDGNWRHYSVPLDPFQSGGCCGYIGTGSFHITIEDFAGVAGDAYFDNITVSSLPVSLSIDPKQTFLRTDSSDSTLPALIIDLVTLGISSGDLVRLERAGDYKNSQCPTCTDSATNMIGVFSSNATLLDPSNLNRVSGAIDVGADYVTGPTFFEQLTTDISQDFFISDTLIQVPAGATHLLVGVPDSAYFDNTDPNGNFALVISEATRPPVVSSLCGPSNPAPISGSTGAQGVFDSTNRDETQGVAWPANAAFAFTDLDTGLVTFFDSAGDQIPPASGFPNPALLPGFSGAEDGFHFTSIRLESGREAAFLTSSSGRTPPVILRSCQDAILETGSSLSWGFDPDLMNALPAAFLGGSGANAVSEGFGPRAGTLPAVGSLYPALGGGGGQGGGGVDGGRGGPAFVISASQRITVNGTIFANGLDAGTGSAPAQGGAAGSVRLGAVLIEGSGSINTAAGLNRQPDGTLGGPASAPGPVAIQAFLQDLFTGSTTTSPVRSNAVVAPVPDNLPEIEIDAVGAASLEFSDFGFPNTGSLSAPDVTLPATGFSVDVNVGVFTVGVPLGTSLRYRAVGTDGSVVTALGSVGSCECSPGEGIATGDLTLNPGVTYQIVVYPETPFVLARGDWGPVPLAEQVLYATSREDRATEIQQAAMISEEEISSPLEKWARAFGAEPQAHRKLAQLHLSKQETPQ